MHSVVSIAKKALSRMITCVTCHTVNSVTIVDLRVPECSEGTSNLGALTQTTHLGEASLVMSAVDGPITGVGVSAALGRTQSRCQHRFIYIGLDSVLRHIGNNSAI